MTISLVLAFKTTEGKSCNIRINSPRADVGRAEAEAVMNDVIARNVFMTSSGATLVSIESVHMIVTSKNELLV